MEDLIKYILLFFFYSAGGWCIESLYCSLGEKKFINRGFLTGPMCPIYGTAALVLTILIYNPFRDKPLIVFLLGILFCDIVEYITSFLMEKLFAARWWDYTYEFMNIRGRICLKHSLYWGIISVVFVKVIHPAVDNLYNKINGDYLIYILIAVLVVFLIDVANAVRKALDIRKLQLKLKKFIEVLTVAFDGAKDTIEGKYEALSVVIDRQTVKVSDFKAQLEDTILQLDQRLTGKHKKGEKKSLASRLFYNNPSFQRRTRSELTKLEKLINDVKANIFENEEMQ